MSSTPVARGLRRAELISDRPADSARFCRELLGWRAERSDRGIDCWVGERCCARIRPGRRDQPCGWRPVFAGTHQHGTLNGPDGTEAAITAGRAQHGPWAPAARAGEPCWIELVTSDPVRADRFWADTLGWEVATGEDSDAPSGVYRAAGRPLASRAAPHGTRPGRGWLCCFAVDDLAGTTDRASGLGAATTSREHPVWGRIALVTGPEGGTFGVAGPPAGWGR